METQSGAQRRRRRAVGYPWQVAVSSVKRWLARALLVLGGLLAGVLVVELGARLLPTDGAAELLFNAPDNAPSGLYSADHRAAYIPTPGFDGEIHSMGYRVPLRVNALGLRGPELTPKTQERWLVLGDSFTFAAQVPEQQTFTQLLASSLGVQAWNAGADGYGTEHERARYLALESELAPDVVLVVFFTGNDFSDNQRWANSLEMARRRPQGTVLNSGFRQPWQQALSRRSVLYGMWEMGQRRRKIASGQSQDAQRWRGELALFHSEGAAELDSLLRQSRPSIRSLRDQAKEAGDRLIVAVASPAFAVESHRTAATLGLVGLDPAQAQVQAPEDAVVRMLRAERVQACPLSTTLRAAYQDGEQVYLDYDGHWNARGHAVVAQALAECAAAKP